LLEFEHGFAAMNDSIIVRIDLTKRNVVEEAEEDEEKNEEKNNPK
jgi:hypothetical protein